MKKIVLLSSVVVLILSSCGTSKIQELEAKQKETEDLL